MQFCALLSTQQQLHSALDWFPLDRLSLPRTILARRGTLASLTPIVRQWSRVRAASPLRAPRANPPHLARRPPLPPFEWGRARRDAAPRTRPPPWAPSASCKGSWARRPPAHTWHRTPFLWPRTQTLNCTHLTRHCLPSQVTQAAGLGPTRRAPDANAPPHGRKRAAGQTPSLPFARGRCAPPSTSQRKRRKSREPAQGVAGRRRARVARC